MASISNQILQISSEDCSTPSRFSSGLQGGIAQGKWAVCEDLLERGDLRFAKPGQRHISQKACEFSLALRFSNTAALYSSESRRTILKIRNAAAFSKQRTPSGNQATSQENSGRPTRSRRTVWIP